MWANMAVDRSPGSIPEFYSVRRFSRHQAAPIAAGYIRTTGRARSDRYSAWSRLDTGGRLKERHVGTGDVRRRRQRGHCARLRPNLGVEKWRVNVLLGLVIISVGVSLPFLAWRLAWMRASMNRRLYDSEVTGRRVDTSLAGAIGFAFVVVGVLLLLGRL